MIGRRPEDIRQQIREAGHELGAILRDYAWDDDPAHEKLMAATDELIAMVGALRARLSARPTKQQLWSAINGVAQIEHQIDLSSRDGGKRAQQHLDESTRRYAALHAVVDALFAPSTDLWDREGDPNE